MILVFVIVARGSKLVLLSKDRSRKLAEAPRTKAGREELKRRERQIKMIVAAKKNDKRKGKGRSS